MKITTTILLLLVVLITGCTNKSVYNDIKPDWDLTYENILNKNNESDKWLWNWLRFDTDNRKNPNQYVSPIFSEISNYPEKTILSSFLIEGPAPHAGEHQSIWVVETRESIILYVYARHNLEIKTTKLKKDQYLKIIDGLAEIKEKQPTIHKDFDWGIGVYPGYFAIVSLFSNLKSQQVKLSYEDYLGKDGILLKLLMPMFDDLKSNN